MATDGWAVTFSAAAMRGLDGAAARPGPSSLYQMQSTHQRPVYQSPYCCIMVRCSTVLMCPLKG